MNTPEQQATLYRKAAETIEMCAPHGIEPMVKNNKQLFNIILNSIGYVGSFEEYEFPLAVIEGQLVWKGDEIYFKGTGCAVTAGSHNFPLVDHNYTLTSPKRTVMVELLVEDAKAMLIHFPHKEGLATRISSACNKALDNLKG